MEKTKRLFCMFLIFAILMAACTVTYAADTVKVDENAKMNSLNSNLQAEQGALLGEGAAINVKNPPTGYKPATGNGTADDTAALQAILDNFDNVYFPVGTYKITSSLVLKSNRHLTGEANATLQKCFSTLAKRLIHVDADISNVTIEGLTFDLKGIGATDDSAYGMIFRGKVENLTVKKCVFKNCSEAIKLDPINSGSINSKNVFMYDNTVKTVANPLGPIFYAGCCDNAVIANNNCDRGKGQAYFIKCINSKIIYNDFSGVDNYWQPTCHLGGIEIYGECQNILVANNTVQSVDGSINPDIVGIRSKNNTDVTITNNKVIWNNTKSCAIEVRRDPTSSDAPAKNNIVSNNTIEGTTTYGIFLFIPSSGYSIENTKIMNNILEGKAIKLCAPGQIYNLKYNNTDIINNTCADITMFKYASTGIRILNNTIKRAEPGAGIIAQNVVDAVIMGNKVICTATVPLAVGIDCRWAKYIVIGENEFVNVVKQVNQDGATDVISLQ